MLSRHLVIVIDPLVPLTAGQILMLSLKVMIKIGIPKSNIPE